MRRSLRIAGLASLSAALLLAAAPIVPCQQVKACPMLAAMPAAGYGGHCEPLPIIDCCAHDRTPLGRDSGAEAVQLIVVAAVPSPVPAAMAAARPPRLRPTTAPVHGDRIVPLYTLLATLLI